MKVIFVIQGEGRGHLTQALALKQMLLHEGHEVVKVLVGKSKNRVIPEFFQNKIGTPIEVFDSPNFLPSKDNRKFNLLRSLAYNTLLVPNYLSSIHLIRKNIQKSGADIIINFYEVLCGITCSLFCFGIPEVCIGHQYLFLHPSFQMPGKYSVPESLLKFFTRITCMGATAKLALSIRDYGDEPVHGIKVVPPLLRQEAKTIIRHHGDYIMGYILNAGFAEDVKAWHGDEATMHDLAARLNKAGAALKAEGVELLYHNHNCELRHVNAEKRAYDILLEETDPQFVNFEFDSYWFTEGGANALAWMQRLGTRMKLWHINDRGTRLTGSAVTPILKTDSMELGTGNMDLDSLMAQALSVGVDAVILESHRNWVDNSPIKSLQLSAEYLKKHT